MRKILKDYRYITLISGIVISIVTCISLFFVNKTVSFTIGLVSNILINFLVGGILLLSSLATKNKFLSILSYLLITQLFLFFDLLIIERNLDLNVYSNVMYLTNIHLYLLIYSLFVIMMSLLSGYILIKNITKKQK